MIEGITRSGKFLLANILSGFPGIEPPQYYGLLENLPFLAQFGFIDKKTALDILRCEIDFHFYEMLIGRNLNHRVSDKSSIYNIPKYEQFLKRSKTVDNEQLVKELKKRYGLYIIHEGMSHLPFYFEALPKLKVISISRHPIELVYSWYQRGLGKRWGNDPLLFQIALDYKGQPIPWFAETWAKQYLEMSEMDRVIQSIVTLHNLSHTTLQTLPPQLRKRVLCVSYEDILSEPETVIKKISTFLKQEPLPEMSKILKRERLPNKKVFAGMQSKIEFVQKRASSKVFEKLTHVS